VFEDGQLTDGLGKYGLISRNTIINHDIQYWRAAILQKRTSIGFQAGIDEASLRSMEEPGIG